MEKRSRVLRGLLCTAAVASSFAYTDAASADTGKLNLHADLGFAMPTASYLAPPGNNDNTGFLGAGLDLSIDYVVSGPFALEFIAGAGFMADIMSGSPSDYVDPMTGMSVPTIDVVSSPLIPWHAGLGGRLRFLDEGNHNLWLAAHLGVFGFDGIQFGADGAVGYEIELSDSISLGPVVRYSMLASGNATPWQRSNDTHFTSAIFVGASLGVRLVARDGEAVADSEVDLDRDDDGILDSTDACPTEPEDFDNHNDEDGCPETETDIDGDGIQNEVDACPEVPEDRDSFQDDDGCPDPDNDADRVLDVNDRCPLDPEDMDGFQDDDGCPDPDNDNDGVVDLQDNCPMDPGIIENRGCPDRDTDGDTVVDRIDNCPTEPGTVPNHGCREQQLVEIREGRLDILEKVYFRVNSHVIERRSYPLLDQVAAVIMAHPEITRIRVEGHTDERGADARNLALSQRRVNSVMQYLIRKGVSRDRLEAVGCGETAPVFRGATEESQHEANRRVEFWVLGPQARASCQPPN